MTTPFQIQSRAPAVSYKTAGIEPPSGQYVTVDDMLVVSCANSDPLFSLLLSYRLLNPDGSTTINQHSFTPTTNRANNNFSVRLSEGFLLSLEVVANTGSLLRGSSFVRVALVRGWPNSSQFAGQLVQGYASGMEALTWPGGLMEGNFNGRGFIRSVTGTTPAAGAEISETVPTNALWRVIAFHYFLTTSATVANRQPNLVVDDGVNIFAVLPIGSSITAGSTAHVTWGNALTNTALIGGVVMNSFVQDLYLRAGYRVRTSSPGLQVGDQFSNVQYVVEEWLTP